MNRQHSAPAAPRIWPPACRAAVLIILLAAGAVFPQKPQLRFEHILQENGLSHSKVNCIVQDRRGFMWFGTNEGLNRYDGYQFTVYLNDPGDPNSLSANLVRCLLEDSRGNLWVGTEPGGLNLYDRKLERFIRLSQDSLSEIRLHDDYINSIAEDTRGRVWLGTSGGIEMVDLQNKTARFFAPYPRISRSNVANRVNSICMDGKRNLWVGTNGGGLCRFDLEDLRFTCYRHEAGDSRSLSDDEIFYIHKDVQDNLWIGTNRGILNWYDRSRDEFRHYYPDANEKESSIIRAIFDDAKGNLWVGTRYGLHMFDRKTRRFTNYIHDPENPYSLSQNSIQVIYKDARGDLWIGTRGGVNFLNMDVQPFVHIRAGANNPRYLDNQVVYSICRDHRGGMWFGTEEGGVNRLNRATGQYTYYTYDRDDPDGIRSNNIKHIVEDREGNIWIATYMGGLNRLDPATGRFVHYRHNPNNPNSLWKNNVQFLFIDRDGDLWICTERNGFDLFDRKRDRFIHVLQGKKTLDFTNCQTVIQDRAGKLWMGFGLSTFGCYDKQSRLFRSFCLSKGRSAGFDLSCIVENAAGHLWIGTIGEGLLLVDKSGNILQSFSKQNGLPSNVVYGILDDDKGNLWLSTANGLCRYHPGTGSWKTFYRENGLQANQFCYNAYLKGRDGTMFFGGINGVTLFHPDSVRENTYVPPVVITGFKIFNKPVFIGGEKSVLKESILETGSITLSNKQSVFTFEFSALNFANSRQNQYAYKLEGFEKEWNEVADRRFATYTNLRPAKYVFRVKAANNDGLWNEAGTSIDLTVLPPFWQKWWFKALGVMAVLLAVRHAINYQIQKRNVLRAKSLANIAQLKLLRNQMNPHFLFNAHNSIRSMILIDRDRAWQMVTELSEFLRYTLLNFNKIESMLGEEISAVNNYLHIEKIRYRDSLEVTFHVEEAAKQCLIPAFSLQPIVENAIKYGMQTSPMPLRIDISIRHRNRTLFIDVSNTGRLVDAASKFPEADEGHGTSIENIKKRLDILFGDKYRFHLFEKKGWVHVKIHMPFDLERKDELDASEEKPFNI